MALFDTFLVGNYYYFLFIVCSLHSLCFLSGFLHGSLPLPRTCIPCMGDLLHFLSHHHVPTFPVFPCVGSIPSWVPVLFLAFTACLLSYLCVILTPPDILIYLFYHIFIFITATCEARPESEFFQSKANHPPADKCMDYMVNKFKHVLSELVSSGLKP